MDYLKSNELKRNRVRGISLRFRKFFESSMAGSEIYSAPAEVPMHTRLMLIENLMYPIFSFEDWEIPEAKKEEIRKTLSYLYYETPNMSGAEAEAMYKYCTPESEVLEFGSGFSTLRLTEKCKHVYSVEHDSLWYGRIAALAMMFKIPNLSLIHSFQHDLGEGDDKSLEASEERNFSYHSVLHQLPKLVNKKFDVVSIDGMCRANCARSILPNLHDDSVVVFSDFYREQRQKERDYGRVFEWYDEVESCKEGNSFVVLKKKKDLVWV